MKNSSIKFKLKYIFFISFFLCFFNILYNVKAINLDELISTVDSSTIANSEYGWSFKFLDGITTLEPFGFTTNSGDLWRKDWDGTLLNYTTDDYEVLRLTDDSQKGKVGVIYHNVGTYQGRVVSMKITVTDWEKLGIGGIDPMGREQYPNIFFSKKAIDVLTTYRPLILRPEWKIQFFYDDDPSQTAINIKGHITVKDLDCEEYLETNIGQFEKGYVISNTNLVKSLINSDSTLKLANKPGNEAFDTTDRRNWATLLFDTSNLPDKAIDYLYSDTLKDGVETDVITENKMIYQWLFGSESLVKFDTPAITKQVNKSSIIKGDTLKYTLSFYAPPFSVSTDYYTKLIIEDDISDELLIEQINIYDDASKNVNNLFTIQNNNNSLVISANSSTLTSDSFYNKNYIVEVTCSVKDNAEHNSSNISNNKYILKNKATIDTNSGLKTSNEVETELYYKIDTKITNGTITQSKNNVVPMSDEKITFKANDGYYIESIIVDGKKIEISGKQYSGEYDFENINDNHEVIVNCERNTSSVVVKYIDQVTKGEIAPTDTLTGFQNDPYQTQAKEVEGYELVVTPSNVAGRYLDTTITVTYEYRKLSDVTVKYVDENTGKEIPGVDRVVTTYKQGENYTTEKKEISRYTYTKDSGNTTGQVADKDIEVVYYYKKTSAGVEVKYIDQVTRGEIAPSENITGLENDSYETQAKEIDGYELVVTPSNASGKMTVEKITVTYEYRKLSDVTVKYVDENTGKEIPGVDRVVTTYKQGENYTTEKKEITGYTYTKDSGNTTGQVADKDIEVVYYYKKTSAGVEVKYIDQVTKGEIAPTENITGSENDTYQTQAKEIDGYELVVTPSNASGKMTVEKITVTYEYRKLSDVTVKYVDENTGEEIPGVDRVVTTYKQGENYTTEKKEISGYTYTKDSGNTTGQVADKDIEVVYYYKKTSAGVEVKYIDQVTKGEIAPSENITGLENDTYQTQAKEVEGYELVVTPSNSSGKMTVEKITVTYEYRKLSDVIVKYVDENTGEEISGVDKVVTTYKEGDTYTTLKENINGYQFTKDSGNTTGTVERENIEVIYYYKKISAGVEVKYIDQVTRDEVATGKTLYGLENDSYETEAKEITGYELVVTPSNASGKMTVEKITVTYEYRKLSDVTVKYVDENTGEEIPGVDRVVTTYKEGENYTTEKKEISGYQFTKDSGNTTGTVERENIDVVYYYKKTSAGVEVRYIDQVTGEPLYPPENITGLEKDPYTTQAKEIDGYELVVTPNNASGEMTVDKIIVTYEYRKLSDVTVKYIDENTGKEIPGVDRVVTTYKQGDKYTTEKKEISGYQFTKDSGNTTGEVADKDIEVVYEYKKISAGVDVKYIDQVTKEEIAPAENITGLEKDPYTTQAKEIDGYELVVTPSNASGKMTVEKITVTYEYRKTANVIIKHIDGNTGETIIEDVVKKYKEGDHYIALGQEIPGYTITKEAENKEGEVGREDIEVIYEYKKISEGLIVKYVDEITNEVMETKEYKGNENDVVKLEEKTFSGYILSRRPDEKEVKLTVEPQEKIFYYRKIVNITIKGIDEKTKEELYTKVQTGIEGNEYTTKPEEIPGYEISKVPNNAEGVYSRDEIEVIYEYKKISGGVKVSYIDRETGEILKEYKIEGLVGDEYKTEKEEIEKYNYVGVEGEERGELEEEEKKVKYYYEKKRGIVEVIYVDEEGNELYKEEMEGKVDEKYKVEEKEIENYRIKERPNNAEGVYEEGRIIVKYVMEKVRGTVVVNFVDREGNKLKEEERSEGYVGEEYNLKAPEIEGYRVVENEEIKVIYIEGEQVIEVIYEKIEEAPQTGDINIYIYMVGIIVGVYVINKILRRKIN